MKQIVEFTKDIEFDTNVDEVTSISLDRKVNNVKNGVVSGVFDLYLEYKESDISVDTEKYSSSIPFDINIDSRYSLDNVKVDIDDFYYEIDDKKVILHINLLLDNLEYEDRIIEEEVPNHYEEKQIEIKDENRDLFNEVEEDVVEVKSEPIYQSFDPKTESYVTYNVHIVREDDNVESICTKYGVSKEDLSYYNDISTIKLGDKLIVPTYKK